MSNKEENPNKHYPYSIDGKTFVSESSTIPCATIRDNGNVPNDFEVYLEVSGPGDDVLIPRTENADLSGKGKESFYSAKPNTNNG